MPVDINLDFLAYFFGVIVLFAGAIVLSLLVGVVTALRTWARCRDRERQEGSNTAAAQGSRLGARLGLATGVLSVVLPTILFSGGSPPGGFAFDRSSLLLFAATLAPAAIWGMLSGAIAGQCKTRRNAALAGGLLFLILGNPLTIGFGVLVVWSALLSATGFTDLTPLLLMGSQCLLVFSVGAGTGTAAVRIGQRRAAALAGSNHPPADLPFPPFESGGIR